jgi:PPOX class probable F420-dependent enzyme
MVPTAASRSRRQDERMDVALARQRVQDARVGRLGTLTLDGRPHLVPVCFALLDEVAYTAVDGKPKSTLRLRRIQNIEKTSATCLLVDHYDEDWAGLWWVRLDGSARVVTSATEADRARSALTTKYRQYDTIAIPGPVIAFEITAWSFWP